MNNIVKFLDLQKINNRDRESIEKILKETLDSGWYLKGNKTTQFEKDYSEYIGTDFTITCSNGLDALTLIFMGYIELGIMKPGDEIIVPANTYIASILAVLRCGLVPVFVEPELATCQIDSNEIEKAITPKTKAIMIVHLYGRCAYTEKISELCKKYNLKLIEDNAQAHGCSYQGKLTGSLGDAAGHSFYPGKNLGALGDAGAVTTDDEALAEIVRSLGNYGSSKKYVFPYKGINSRMDELQAGVLSFKLSKLNHDNLRRKKIATQYYKELKNPFIKTLKNDKDQSNVYHIFPIFTQYRDDLQNYLKGKGIETLIHYPIPPHKQEALKEFSYLKLPKTDLIHESELSLPISQVMTCDDVKKVIMAINDWKP